MIAHRFVTVAEKADLRAAVVAAQEAGVQPHPTERCEPCHRAGFVAARMVETPAGLVCEHIERHPLLPEVGLGATLCYPQDRYPYVVTAVSASGSVVTLEELEYDHRAIGAAGECNGFPVHDYTFPGRSAATAPRTGKTIKAHRRGNGLHYAHGIRIVFGEARYFRNYAD